MAVKKASRAIPDAPINPGHRACCILTTFEGIPFHGPVDIGGLGRHRFGAGNGGDKTGVVYTCRGGFIDLGHVRDLIDLTRFYHHELTKRQNNKTTSKIKTLEGEGTVILNNDIVSSDRLPVAQSLALDESIFHEILSYFDSFPGGHNSAFSPEDLTSNWLGTYIAGKAISDSGPGAFDDKVTKEIKSTLQLLGAVSKSETVNAFQSINGVYVTDGFSRLAIALTGYLKRRNFRYDPISPCLLPGFSACSDTTFPAAIPTQRTAAIKTQYSVRYQLPKPIQSLLNNQEFLSSQDFEPLINAIKTNAESKYGANFQSCAH
jgi:Protein of unknown function (DUF4056)